MPSLCWSDSVQSPSEPHRPRPAPMPLAQRTLAATPEGSALVTSFNTQMKKAQANHSGPLVPTVCIYVQTHCTFLVPKGERILSGYLKKAGEVGGSVFALAWGKWLSFSCGGLRGQSSTDLNRNSWRPAQRVLPVLNLDAVGSTWSGPRCLAL